MINSQKLFCPEEYVQLERRENLNTDSKNYQSNIILKNGIIKMRARLELSLQLPEKTRYLTILRKKARLWDLLNLH